MAKPDDPLDTLDLQLQCIEGHISSVMGEIGFQYVKRGIPYQDFSLSVLARTALDRALTQVANAISTLKLIPKRIALRKEHSAQRQAARKRAVP